VPQADDKVPAAHPRGQGRADFMLARSSRARTQPRPLTPILPFEPCGVAGLCSPVSTPAAGQLLTAPIRATDGSVRLVDPSRMPMWMDLSWCGRTTVPAGTLANP